MLTADELRRAAKLSLYRKSFERFAGQQLKIKPKLPGSPMIPLVMNQAQQVLERVAQEQLKAHGWIRMLVHKYRQPGGSTWATARGFHMASLHPNINSVVIAHDDETAGHIFGINKLFYESMSPDMRPLARYHSKEELVFENPDPRTRTRWPGLRSRITFMTAKNIHAGTGHTLHAVHLSEAAKFLRAKEVWSSLFPSIPPMPGTSVILETTAHFTGQWFKEFYYQDTHGGPDEYRRVFLPWSLSPEYALAVEPSEMDELDDEERYLQERHALTLEQLKWRRARIREAGNDAVAKKLFNQEFPLTSQEAWIDMNMGVFDARALYELGERVGPPLRRCDVLPGPSVYDAPDGHLSVWEEPQPGELYDLAADPASGSETGDWSVAEVVKRRNREQVAEWRGKIGVLDFAQPLFWLGRWYNTAQIGVEMDGLGIGTNDRLNEMNYPYCLTPDQRVLTADLRWVPLGDIHVGDELLGFDEKAPGGGKLRKFLLSRVIGCEPREAAVYRIVLSDGTALIATADHPWIVTSTGLRNTQEWRVTAQLRIGHRLPKFFTPWSVVRNYEAGWMAGLLDGEGSVGRYRDGTPKGGHTQLSLVQKPGLVLDEACTILTRWGFQYSQAVMLPSGCHSLSIGTKSEIARLLGTTRPVRLLPKVVPSFFGSLRGETSSTVEAVERIGAREVIMIGTTTQTYFAEGYGSHNCYIRRKHETVIPKLTNLSGWHTSYDSKKKLVTRARHFIAHKDVIIRSPILHNELREFSIRQTEQREFYEGSGKFDDAVMSWMIALSIGLDEAMFQPTSGPPAPPQKRVHREPGLHDDSWITSSNEPMVNLAEQLKGWK